MYHNSSLFINNHPVKEINKFIDDDLNEEKYFWYDSKYSNIVTWFEIRFKDILWVIECTMNNKIKKIRGIEMNLYDSNSDNKTVSDQERWEYDDRVNKFRILYFFGVVDHDKMCKSNDNDGSNNGQMNIQKLWDLMKHILDTGVNECIFISKTRR